MQVIKMKEKKGSVDFEKAHSMANEKAKSILGDYMSIASYNDELKLVSPTLVACNVEEGEDCGAESYARANGAELLVDFDSRYKFYYRNIADSYEEPSPSPFNGYTSSNPHSDLGE